MTNREMEAFESEYLRQIKGMTNECLLKEYTDNVFAVASTNTTEYDNWAMEVVDKEFQARLIEVGYLDNKPKKDVIYAI